MRSAIQPRQNLFSEVGKIGEAGNEIMRNISSGEVSHMDNGSRLQEAFICLAKTVGNSTVGLFIASKNVANHCMNQHGVNEVISLVTMCLEHIAVYLMC